jgi:hypothetical protein
MSLPQQRKQTDRDQLLEELRAIRREQAALRRLFDEFFGAFLNAKFPFGKAQVLTPNS